MKVYAATAATPTCSTAATARCCCADPNDDWPSPSLEQRRRARGLPAAARARGRRDVPAGRAAARRSPTARCVLALEHVDGRRLDALAAGARSTTELLDAVWREVGRCTRASRAPGAARRQHPRRPTDGRCIIDFGFGEESATPRAAGDRPGRAARVARRARRRRAAVASAARGAGPARRWPPPCPTSSRWPSRPRPASRRRSRCCTSSATRSRRRPARSPSPLERLVRVRPRTLVMIAALVGAFYVLLPQLANVGDSFARAAARQLGVAGRLRRDVAAHLRRRRGRHGRRRARTAAVRAQRRGAAGLVVRQPRHARPTSAAWRSTCASCRRPAFRPAEAVTGIGLNVARRRASSTSCCSSCSSRGPGQSDSNGVQDPGEQQAARRSSPSCSPLVGVVIATRRGRRLLRTHVVALPQAVVGEHGRPSRAHRRSSPRCSVARSASRSPTSPPSPPRSPRSHGSVTLRPGRRGVPRASLIAAAAPTPAASARSRRRSSPGSPASGMDRAIAVAAVLSYRLVTYWLPILPGWLALPPARAARLHLIRLGRARRARGTPSPPRPNAQRDSVPTAARARRRRRVERQVRAGVHPRERHDRGHPEDDRSPRAGDRRASTAANANATAVCPDT